MSRPNRFHRQRSGKPIRPRRKQQPTIQWAGLMHRAVRPVLWRVFTACILSLLAPPTIAASPPDTASSYASPGVIYPSAAFAVPQTAEQAALPWQIGSISAAPQFGNFDDAVQPISFEQPASLSPESVPAGTMLNQMVQEDTHGPDLNSIVNQQGYLPPPTCASPDVADYHSNPCDWHWQVMPQGIIYQSYMAGTKEPRLSTWTDRSSFGAFANATPQEPYTGVLHDMWDVTLGARVGLWRYGNSDPNWPEGWQLDIEGGVFPRLDPKGFSTPLIGDDYRFGIPLTYGIDQWEFKMGYYHVSAHVGDEYLLYVNPLFNRINYVRDSAILGAGYFFTPSFRTYGEIGAAAVDGGAKPVEIQFGFEWMQAKNTGFRGGPFLAMNTDLRQEVDFGGNISVQFGWMWRQYVRGSNLRIGAQYFYGKDDEYEFFERTVTRFGWGIWFDF